MIYWLNGSEVIQSTLDDTSNQHFLFEQSTVDWITSLNSWLSKTHLLFMWTSSINSFCTCNCLWPRYLDHAICYHSTGLIVGGRPQKGNDHYSYPKTFRSHFFFLYKAIHVFFFELRRCPPRRFLFFFSGKVSETCGGHSFEQFQSLLGTSAMKQQQQQE